MSRLFQAVLIAACVLSVGCGSGVTKKPKIYPSGEKATIGALTYSVVDVHIAATLGEDQATARTPQDRFFLIKINASNSSAETVSIPALTLVDDHGKTYPEIADGNGVQNWLGVVRRVDSGQTADGVVVFDAPAQHYRLRLTDDTEEDISIDIPLNFVNESNVPTLPPVDPSTVQVPTIPPKAK